MKTLKLIGWLLLPILFSSCGKTIAPRATRATQPSYSVIADSTGNHQTSGVLGWRTNHNLVIDSTGRDSYNSLITRGYGARLTPPVTNADYGLSDYTNNPVEALIIGSGNLSAPFPNPGGLHEMNPPAQDDWATMNALQRQPKLTQPP